MYVLWQIEDIQKREKYLDWKKKEMRANSKINSIEKRPGWLGTEKYCKALLSACLVDINLKGCKDAKQVFKI